MAKFQTGHEVFDHISSLQRGSTVLILDETGFESIIFLNALFKNFGDESNLLLISDRLIETPFKLQLIHLEKMPSLTELSIEIERFRSLLKEESVMVHNYLPHILVREDEERVLKLVESWRERVKNENIVELYTLPNNSFPTFEAKIRSLVGGIIVIKIIATDKGKYFTFQISGICDPEYHTTEFPFMVKERTLLVKWGEEFTDRLFEEEQEQILRRQEYIKKNLYSLEVIKGEGTLKGLDLYERWLLAQCIGMKVSDIYYYFPDKFEEVSKSLAIWNLRGIVKLEKREESIFSYPKKGLSTKSKLLLKFPTPLALTTLFNAPNLIPLDVYHSLRKSVITFITAYTPLSEEEFIEKLSILEGHFQELTTRVTSVNKLIEGGESPELKLDIKYLPKMLSLALYYGYQLKPQIVELSKGVFKIKVPECFLCNNIKSDKPVCHLLVGTLIGTSGVLVKKKFQCQEVQCKAKGDDSCTFNLKVLSESQI